MLLTVIIIHDNSIKYNVSQYRHYIFILLDFKIYNVFLPMNVSTLKYNFFLPFSISGLVKMSQEVFILHF